jgi:hypothetical protein
MLIETTRFVAIRRTYWALQTVAQQVAQFLDREIFQEFESCVSYLYSRHEIITIVNFTS